MAIELHLGAYIAWHDTKKCRLGSAWHLLFQVETRRQTLTEAQALLLTLDQILQLVVRMQRQLQATNKAARHLMLGAAQVGTTLPAYMPYHCFVRYM